MSTALELLFPALGPGATTALVEAPCAGRGPVERFPFVHELAAHGAPADLIAASPADPAPTVYERRADGRARQRRCSPGEAARAYLAGHTVSIERGAGLSVALGAFGGQLAAELGLDSNGISPAIILTPPDVGVTQHFDGLEVISVQVQGRKRWRYGRGPVPAADFPYFPTESGSGARGGRVPAYALASLTDDAVEAGEETLVAPGDVLSIPRGWWHATRSLDAGVSVTFRIAAAELYKVVAEGLAARLRSVATWRQPMLGLVGEGRTEARARVVSAVRALLQELDVEALADECLSLTSGARLEPRPALPLRFAEHADGWLVFVAGRPEQGMRGIDAVVIAALAWLLGRPCTFERELIRRVPVGAESQLGEALEWLARVGALAIVGPRQIGRSQLVLQRGGFSR